MEVSVWEWIGFGCVLTAVFIFMLWVVSVVTRKLGQTLQGLVMLGSTMVFTAVVYWELARRLMCG
jgi:hypothetical protein